MSSRFCVWCSIALVGVGLITLGGSALWGADPATPTARTPKGVDSAAGKDPFAVPDLKPPELLKWIQKGEKFQPQVSTREERTEFLKKSRHALIEAADKILEAKTSDSIHVSAIKSKKAALDILSSIHDPDAPKLVAEFIEQIKDEKQPEIAKMAKTIDLAMRLGQVSNPAVFTKAWVEFKSAITETPADKDLLGMAVALGSVIEGVNPRIAGVVLPDLGEILVKSKDPAMVEAGKKFEGIARRLTLLGKPVEIKGTTLDGKPFDQGTLQGKVVLVDFWATWCPPCREEMPNVKANYEKYHSKGFEVVGISLDADLGDLQKFLADEKIAWPILFPKDKKDQYWSNPMAVYYGISGIPTAFLTNEKGEVISVSCRGPELGRRLEQMLGKTDDTAAK